MPDWKDLTEEQRQRYSATRRQKWADGKRYNRRLWGQIFPTAEEFWAKWNQLFEQQKGRCKICKVHQNQLKKRLNMDHCHETLRIRGLLCGSCNLRVGWFEKYCRVITTYLNPR